jgi:hypothetical protein
MDNFVDLAEQKIEQLRVEEDHLALTLRGLEARRSELQKQIEAGISALAYYRQVMALPVETSSVDDPAPKVTVLEPRNRPRRTDGPTVGDRLEDFMAGRGGEAQVSELANHLIDTGVYPQDEHQSLYRRVYAMLLRDRRFYKVSPGRFGLVPQGKSLSMATNARSWVAAAPDQPVLTNMGVP